MSGLIIEGIAAESLLKQKQKETEKRLIRQIMAKSGSSLKESKVKKIESSSSKKLKQVKTEIQGISQDFDHTLKGTWGKKVKKVFQENRTKFVL